MMRILITGGTGFVGNNLVRRLVSNENSIGLLVRKENKTWRTKDLFGQVDFLDGDLTDKNGLIKLVKDYSPEFIYHFAAYGAYPRFQRNENTMLSVNVGGMINLLEAANGIPIINVGSSSEYGVKDKAMVETDSCYPESYYGKTKLMQTLYCSDQGIPTLRLFSIYGLWDDQNRLIPTLIRAKINRECLHLVDSIRDYLYIDDVTAAFLRATERYTEIKGQIINIGSGQQRSTEEILNTLNKIDSKKLTIRWDFKAVQKEPDIWVADISKAGRLLDWSPEISLEEGLKRTYGWFMRFGRKL